MNNAFFGSILDADLDKTATQRNLLSGQLVHFFVKVSEEAVHTITATLSNFGHSGKASLRLRLYNYDLPCTKESHKAAIGAPRSQKYCKTLHYPYFFITSENFVKTPGEFCTVGFYSYHSLEMRALSLSAGSRLIIFTDSHTFVTAHVQGGANEVNEILLDDDVIKKEITVCSSDP